jgi:hypothetical protein
MILLLLYRSGLNMTLGIHHAMPWTAQVPIQGTLMWGLADGLKSSLQYHHETTQANTSLAIRPDGPHIGANVRSQFTPETSAKVQPNDNQAR